MTAFNILIKDMQGREMTARYTETQGVSLGSVAMSYIPSYLHRYVEHHLEEWAHDEPGNDKWCPIIDDDGYLIFTAQYKPLKQYRAFVTFTDGDTEEIPVSYDGETFSFDDAGYQIDNLASTLAAENFTFNGAKGSDALYHYFMVQIANAGKNMIPRMTRHPSRTTDGTQVYHPTTGNNVFYVYFIEE